VGAGSDGLTLEIRRVFSAARPLVFGAFADPDKMKQWWGPQGFTIPSLDYEPRVGADYRIEMKPPGAPSFYLSGEFQAIEPPERLAYSFAWEDPDPDDIPNVVELTFQDLGMSSALLLHHGPFKTEARRELLRGGWTESLSKLEDLLSRASPA
jgi:uncharacterized protein YndB with AHSA1/START domain